MKPVLILAIAALTAGTATERPRAVFTAAARAALATIDRPDRERFMCMRGWRVGNLVVVASAEPGRESGLTRYGRFYLTEVTCPDSAGVVGLAHNHPAGADGDRRCWYRFPGTDVPTSDLRSFRESKTELGVIVCGSRLVWEVKPERENP